MTPPTSSHILPKTGWKGILENWRSDFLAAISVSLVAMPLGLGVAVASGAPPVAGLISAIVGGIVVTLFRGSHLAINGPAAGLIAVILSAIHSMEDGSGQTLNYVLAAIVIAGALQVVLGFLKLGRIAEIIPSSVIQGIMVAIGIIIFSSQIHVAMGTTTDGANTVDKLLDIFKKLPEANPFILAISITGLILLIVIPKIQSRLLHFFPASLWVLMASIPFVYLFNFFEPHTFSLFGNAYDVGPKDLINIPDDLTKMFLFPNFSKVNTMEFWVAVISITLIASIQTLAMAKAVDKLDPYKRRSDLNKDLIGVGLGTMVSGAIGGLPIITVIVRSTVNITNNAKTKWSNFYHGILLIIFLVLLAPVIQKVPLAALAAILVYIGFRLASPKVFKKIYEMGMEQLIFMVTTLVITLYTDLLWGILGGMLFTLFVHILLARLPIGMFFKMAFDEESNLFPHKDGSFELQIKGVANFLTIPKVNKLLEMVPPGADVLIDLSKTRLVGMTFMEKIVEFLRSQEDSGGKVTINGLEQHVSSSNHNRALKISLNPITHKLSPREVRLKNIAEENSYNFANDVNWNTSYLRNFQFFEIRPIERKSNCLHGVIVDSNVQWEIADVTFNEGASFSSEVFHATVMTMRLPKPIPKFVLDREGILDRFFDRIMAFSGYKDIDFELYTGFSSEFLLMGENEAEIRNFFTKELMDFFESEQVHHIESNGEALLIFNKMKLARTDETLRFIKFSEQLAGKIGCVES
ncbi:MAG: MFS superfamily sulfate permease-like transporter [Polaribacter sp.]|jgi:MFS superfamily sulfate permease-like transporter